MPKLPTLESLGERPSPQPASGVVSYRATHGNETAPGLAVAELGSRISAAADMIAGMISESKKEFDDLRAEEAVNQAKDAAQVLEMGEQGFSRQQGENVFRKPILKDYTNKFDDVISGISRGLGNGEQRLIFERRIAPLRSIYTGRLVQHVGREADQYAKDVYTNTIRVEQDGAISNWAVPDALESAFARMDFARNQEARREGWSDQRLQDERSRQVSGVYLGIVDRLLANRQDTEAAQFYERIRGDLNPDSATRIERALTGARERHEAEAAAVAKENAARLASDVEIAVRRGQAGYGAIESAYQSRIITPAKRVELTTYLDTESRNAAQRATVEREQLGRVQFALDGNGFLDFRVDRDRRAVDTHFERVLTPAMRQSGLPADQQTQMVADYVARTGIVPSPVKQTIRGGLRMGTPEVKAGVADLLDRLKDANPQLLNDFSEQDIALGSGIQAYVRAGVAPLQAVALAEKSMNVPDAEREARKTRYTAEKAPAKNLKHLQSEITGFRWFSASLPKQVPDAMAGAYERLVREEFTRTGDLEVAQRTGLDQLRRVWGVTNIDGKPRWMAYAPETIYRVPGEDGGWISEQLRSEITKNALFEGKPDITLAADSLTAREQQPSYVVLNRREGVLEPVLGSDGKPLRFRPDYASSAAGKRRQEAVDRIRAEAESLLGGAKTELPAVTGRAMQRRKAP